MTKKRKPEPNDPEQSKRFIDTARALEADETGTLFEKVVAGVKTDQEKASISATRKIFSDGHKNL